MDQLVWAFREVERFFELGTTILGKMCLGHDPYGAMRPLGKLID